ARAPFTADKSPPCELAAGSLLGDRRLQRGCQAGISAEQLLPLQLDALAVAFLHEFEAAAVDGQRVGLLVHAHFAPQRLCPPGHGERSFLGISFQDNHAFLNDGWRHEPETELAMSPKATTATRLTSPDRVVYPDTGATKRAVADYYLGMA